MNASRIVASIVLFLAPSIGSASHYLVANKLESSFVSTLPITGERVRVTIKVDKEATRLTEIELSFDGKSISVSQADIGDIQYPDLASAYLAIGSSNSGKLYLFLDYYETENINRQVFFVFENGVFLRRVIEKEVSVVTDGTTTDHP